MMRAATTATWRTTGHGSERAGRGTGRLARDLALQSLVQAKLELEWNPEQIAAWLRQTYPNRRAWHVCHETIYQAIYHGGDRGLTRKLTAKLRTGRPLRKRCRKPSGRAPRFVKVRSSRRRAQRTSMRRRARVMTAWAWV
jgi:IS30 family transposase